MRAKDLTGQLLTFARGGAPIKRLADLGGLLQDVVGFALRGANVLAEFDIAEDLWSAEFDAGQISQVVQNLTTNARQAMAGGGRFRVSAHNVDLEQGSVLPLLPGRYIHLVFADEGIGISPEHLPRIFDPYFTTKQLGSGLGLATTYSIVTSHGGHIGVESQVGHGATFHVYLPASMERAAAGAAVAAPKSRPEKSARILLMDDEEMVLQLGARVLQYLGHSSETALEGDAMLARYAEAMEQGAPFDLVIMDLTIPGGMGGREAVGRLHDIDPNARAIVSSGYATDPIMANYADHGFCGVVTKPWDIDEMAVAVRRALDD